MRTKIESVAFKVPDVRTQLFDGAKVPTPQNMFLENPQRHGIRNLLEIKTLGDPPTTSVDSTHIKSYKNRPWAHCAPSPAVFGPRDFCVDPPARHCR